MRGILISFLCLTVGFGSYWFLAPTGASFGLFESISAGTLRLIATFLAVIGGVVLGSFYRELRGLKAQGVNRVPHLWTFFLDASRSTDMWLGLLGSPVVYALLLRSSEGMTLGGMILTGLENGFCCLLILNSLLDRDTPTRRARKHE